MIDDTISRIREHLQQPGVTKTGLAAAAGLHPNTLLGMDRPNWNPTAETLRKLEDAISPPESAAA